MRRTSVDGGEADVPFVTADPLPVVRVIANGKAANFIVDTGADVDLEPSFAAGIGLKTQSAGAGTFAGGKQASVQSGMLKSLALGGATAYDVPVHVFPTHSSALFPTMQIDGIVGTTYFERFLVTIDYPQNRLILRPRSQEVSAAFEAAAAASHTAIVPCYLVGDHFVMAPAQVDDTPPGLYLFDSGLAGGGLMPSQLLVEAAKIQLDQSHAGSGVGGGGAVQAVPFASPPIAVGSTVQGKVRGLFTPEGSPFGLFSFMVWGIISNDFLRHYAYTVDFDAMKLILAD
jgi:Aspartyl protease